MSRRRESERQYEEERGIGREEGFVEGRAEGFREEGGEGEGFVNGRERRYERGQEGRYRRFRRREERQIEIVTLGLTLIVFMLPVLFSDPNNPTATDGATPLVLMLGGMILLAGAFFQMQRRFRVNPLTWLGGAAMLTFGVVEFQGKIAPLGPLLPILLFGGVIVGSFLTGEF
ncbi:MAG: hypothetical protein ACYDBJ_13725 [Aggregatilineales bacterium]